MDNTGCKKRLASLDRFLILNFDKDEKFDHLISTVKDQLCVDNVSLSFIDNQSVWYKSHSRLEPFKLSLKESICSTVIAKETSIFSEDAKVDKILGKHSAVTADQGVRFYMGAPVCDEQGQALGTLCAYSDKKRKIEPSEKIFLKNMAKQAFYLLRESHLFKDDRSLEITESQTDLDVLKYCSDLGIWKWDLVSSQVSFDDRWCQIVGLEKNEMEQNFLAFENLVHPDDLKSVTDHIGRYLEGKLSRYEISFRVKHKKGHWVTVLAKGKVFRDEAGVAVLFCGTHFDMSYVKQVEERAEHIQKLSSEIQRMGDIGGWEFNIIESQLVWTDAVYKIYGLSKDAPITIDKAISFYSELDQQKIKGQIKNCIDLGETFVGDFQFVDAFGVEKWVRSYGEPILNQQGEVTKLMGTFQNITELKKAHVSLQENAKLIALGEMAGGVAHEINNPLAIINSSAESLERVFKKNNFNNPLSVKFLGNIQHTVNRISKIVDGLKKLSRDGSSENIDSHQLHEIIADSLALCTEKFRSRGIELSVELYNNVEILCRPVELSQVIINVLNNSFYEIQDQRDACIWIRVVTERQGWVLVEIEDNGKGVPPHLVDKIMEPFFTTKPTGQGTGLGLSISREIIESMGGKLILKRDTKGACFSIELKKSKDHEEFLT